VFGGVLGTLQTLTDLDLRFQGSGRALGSSFFERGLYRQLGDPCCRWAHISRSWKQLTDVKAVGRGLGNLRALTKLAMFFDEPA
jgi:hypothetical protein